MTTKATQVYNFLLFKLTKQVSNSTRSSYTVYWSLREIDVRFFNTTEASFAKANEVSDAVTKENLTAELADVVEVIHALAKASDITIEEIEAARLEKRAVNGHFQASNYVNYIEVAETNHKVIEYLDNKERHYKFDK